MKALSLFSDDFQHGMTFQPEVIGKHHQVPKIGTLLGTLQSCDSGTRSTPPTVSTYLSTYGMIKLTVWRLPRISFRSSDHTSGKLKVYD